MFWWGKKKKSDKEAAQTAEVREILQTILEGMGVEATIETSERDDRLILNALCGPDDSMVIGRRGKTLDAIQLIVNRIAGRRLELDKRILVDVSGYRERRRCNLIDMATRSVERVQETGLQVLAGPYNAYERHIIHSTVQDDPQVTTVSQGDGDQKKVAFKLAGPEEQPDN